jgi:Protein of unknown function (DUF732)
MTPTRWLASLSAPVLIGAGLLAGTTVASASPQDDDYFARLAAIGFIWPPEHHADVVSLGHHICVDKWTGWSNDAISQDAHKTMSQEGFSFQDVAGIVNAAEAAYCPD